MNRNSKLLYCLGKIFLFSSYFKICIVCSFLCCLRIFYPHIPYYICMYYVFSIFLPWIFYFILKIIFKQFIKICLIKDNCKYLVCFCCCYCCFFSICKHFYLYVYLLIKIYMYIIYSFKDNHWVCPSLWVALAYWSRSFHDVHTCTYFTSPYFKLLYMFLKFHWWQKLLHW